MAEKKKEAGGKSKTPSDRKRLAYLKIRYGEIKNETQAIKKEMADLRTRMGAGKKKKGKDEAGGDDE